MLTVEERITLRKGQEAHAEALAYIRVGNKRLAGVLAGLPLGNRSRSKFAVLLGDAEALCKRSASLSVRLQHALATEDK